MAMVVLNFKRRREGVALPCRSKALGRWGKRPRAVATGKCKGTEARLP